MKTKLFISAICLLLMFGCQEDKLTPIVKSDAVPAQITDIQVENLPGGAKITYALPDDKNLAYVMAVFSTKSGEQRTVKSSLYKNFVQLDGFFDTAPYQVTLYSVSKSEVKSQPIFQTINPLTPPIKEVFNTITAVSDFGGINFTFLNQREQEYVFHILLKDSTDKWVEIDRLYSKAKTRDYTVRGLKPVETQFAIYVTDKWQNVSDSLKTTLTPLYEELADKKLWKVAPLPSDYTDAAYANRKLDQLWDDQHGTYDYYLAAAGGPSPSWFTIDLGVTFKLSRLKINQYEGIGFYAYNLGNPRLFEIWGSNTAVDDWSQWTLIKSCESIKPSGLPIGTRSAEDLAYALAGEDFNFGANVPPFRYIRFKLIATWGRTPGLLLDEITFWGQKP